MTEQTLFIVKPDGVERKLVGDIISRFEHKGFNILKLKFLVSLFPGFLIKGFLEERMKYGFVLPKGDARTAAEFAGKAARTAGEGGRSLFAPITLRGRARKAILGTA